MKTIRLRFSSAICALILAACLVGAPRSEGAIVTYTSRSAFEAASASLQTLDFEGIAEADSYVFYGNSVTFSDVTFTSQDDRLFVFDNGFYGANGPPTGYLNNNVGDLHGIDITLPSGTTAFGADFSRINQGHANEAFTARFSFFGETPIDLEVTAGPGTTFYGFISDQPLVSLSYNDLNPFASGHSETLDNVSFGVAPVPEPAPLFAVALLLLPIGISIWRTLRKARKAQHCG